MDEILNEAYKASCKMVIAEELMAGLATKVMAWPALRKHLHERFSSVFENTSYGVTYHGVEMCSPEETASKKCREANRVELDLTQDTMYLIKLDLRHHGKPLDTNYLNMVYTKEAGIIIISGSIKCIVPVLTDKSISPNETVYVRFLRDKIEYKGLGHRCYRRVGDQSVDDALLISHLAVYEDRSGRSTPVERGANGSDPSILLYLFTKYGYVHTCKWILGYVPKLIKLSEMSHYDKHKYTIYTSTGRKPAKKYKGKEYLPTNVAMVAPTSKVSTDMDKFAVNMFYVLDYETNLRVQDILDSKKMMKTLSMILYGRANPKKSYDNFQDKMKSLLTYVDKYFVSVLDDEFGDTLEEEIRPGDFFKVLKVIYTNFQDWKIAGPEISSSAYDKRMAIYPYILGEIFSRLHKLHFKLSQSRPQPWNYGAVNNMYIRNFTKGAIYQIRSSNPACVSMATYSGAHKYPKITSTMELQFNLPSSTGNTKSRGSQDASTVLHHTHPLVGSMYALTANRSTLLKTLAMGPPYDPITNTFIPTKKQEKELERLSNIIHSMPSRPSFPYIPKAFNRFATLYNKEKAK